MLHPRTPSDGNPGSEPGLYVAYVDDELTIFAERIFLFWDGQQWFYPSSDQKYRDQVYGWIGPLASMKFEG